MAGAAKDMAGHDLESGSGGDGTIEKTAAA
jgi:hypothetical protein